MGSACAYQAMLGLEMLSHCTRCGLQGGSAASLGSTQAHLIELSTPSH